MARIAARDSSIYWGSAAVAPRRMEGTRNVSIDLGTDFIDDTVHGSQVRTFQPTFPNFGVSITGLYDNATAATTGSKQIIDDAISRVSGQWSIYLGNISRYFTGTGYVSVDTVGAPYDDFSPFDWSLRATGTISFYQVGG